MKIRKENRKKITNKSYTKNRKHRIRPFKNVKISIQLVLSSLFIMAVPLTIVVFFFYNSAVSAVESKVKMITNELSTQANTAMNMQIAEIQNLSTQIFSNQSVYNNLTLKINDDSYSKYQKRNNAISALNSYSLSTDYLESIYVYLDSDQSIINSGTAKDDKYLKESFKTSNEYSNFVGQRGVRWISGLNNNYSRIYLLRNMSNITYGTELGYMLLEIREAIFSDIIKNINLGENSSFYITDADGTIIISADEELLGKKENESLLSEINTNLSDNIDSLSFVSDDTLISYSICSNGWIGIAKIPSASLTSEIETVGRVAIGVSLLCALVAMVIAFLIAISICRPIKRIVNLMKSAETGDLTVKSDEHGKSEIGQLSQSFDNMISNINALVKSSSDIAQKVFEDTGIVNSVASQTSASAKQVSMAIESISKGSAEQALSADKTNETIHGLADNISNSEQSLEMFADIINDTKTIDANALETVNKLNERSEQTLEVFNTIHNNISELNNSSKEIMKIINLIDDISEQTNLLSLNATIEAARAGEAGKGFTVVAGEVGKLAVQSKDATRLINKIIKSIQKQTISTVNVVEKGTDTFKEQLSAVKETNIAFKDIDKALNDIMSKIDILSETMNSISTMKDSATQSVEEIATITEETASAAEEVLATGQQQSISAEKLNQLASHLSEIVEELKQNIASFKI